MKGPASTAEISSYRALVESHAADLRSAGLLREDLLIANRWVAATGGERLAVTDPATGAVLADVACASAADAARAVEAADSARRQWAARPATERADLLLAWHDLISQHEQELAVLLTIEQGKPLAEARGEIAYSAAFVRFFAEEARRAYGEVIPHNRPGRRLLALRQPVGVVAAITPWNFPALMIARKVAPAIAAGCTVVLKPASETPLSALALAELGVRAGLPAGVLNVVHGDPVSVGSVLTGEPAVRMLTFTGSTDVGRLLMAQCAPTVKRLGLELGGNAPFVVFDDADLEAAVAGAIDSKFRNAGQTCVCANRILVQDGVYEEFADAYVQAVSALRVGHGLGDGVTIGPLITAEAVAKVERHIAGALAGGAELRCGGVRHELGGTFFAPTVLTGATPEMEIATAETFGPAAPLLRFGTEDQALALANATESGLSAYFYTRDAGRMVRFGEGLEFGVVGVNTGAISYEGAPFGGMKQSGIGREGSHHGMDEFLELKYLCVDGLG
jgi:succinate-semialdehyde dehydrogenase / glutarate-semialdehyde dehydrogenase